MSLKISFDAFVLTVYIIRTVGCSESLGLHALVIAGASLLPWAHRCTGSAGYWLALLTTHTLCAQSNREMATLSVVGAHKEMKGAVTLASIREEESS